MEVLCGIESGCGGEVEGDGVCGAFGDFHARLVAEHAVVGHGELAMDVVIDAEHFHGGAGGEAFFDYGVTGDQAELGVHFSHGGGLGGPFTDEFLHPGEVAGALVGRHGRAGGVGIGCGLAGREGRGGGEGEKGEVTGHWRDGLWLSKRGLAIERD